MPCNHTRYTNDHCCPSRCVPEMLTSQSSESAAAVLQQQQQCHLGMMLECIRHHSSSPAASEAVHGDTTRWLTCPLQLAFRQVLSHRRTLRDISIYYDKSVIIRVLILQAWRPSVRWMAADCQSGTFSGIYAAFCHVQYSNNTGWMLASQRRQTSARSTDHTVLNKRLEMFAGHD